MSIEKRWENGLEYIVIENAFAEAKIALQGAHLFYYQKKGESPLLWLGDKAQFEPGKAIRGGVPICFPWFGKNRADVTLLQHGFARNQLWEWVSSEEREEGSTHIQLQLTANETTRKVWDYAFILQLDVIIGSELVITLTTTNQDQKPFELTQALHTYFNISDIDTIQIDGLDGTIYHNNLDGQEYSQDGDLIINQEVDRIYYPHSDSTIIQDSERTVTLISEGVHALVVWNPWIDKAKAMVDMSDEGYRKMICLETANAGRDIVVVEPNGSHSLKAIIRTNLLK